MTKYIDLPSGIDSFKDIRKENCYYVDKSLFIKDVLESGKNKPLLYT